MVAYGQDEAAPSIYPARFHDQLQWRQGGSPRRYCWQSLPRRAPTCDRESCPATAAEALVGRLATGAVALGVALILKTGLSVADYQTLKAEDCSCDRRFRTAIAASIPEVPSWT